MAHTDERATQRQQSSNSPALTSSESLDTPSPRSPSTGGHTIPLHVHHQHSPHHHHHTLTHRTDLHPQHQANTSLHAQQMTDFHKHQPTHTSLSRHECESLLQRAYLTNNTALGRAVVDHVDRAVAEQHRSSLCFGELLPAGVDKMLDSRHLDAARATTLVDLGSGIGRVAIQAFFQYANLKKVIGVELSVNRTQLGLDALTRIAQSPPTSYAFHVTEVTEQLSSSVNLETGVDEDNAEVTHIRLGGAHNDRSITKLKARRLETIPLNKVTTEQQSVAANAPLKLRDMEEKTVEGTEQGRVLELKRGDLFVDGLDALDADIVILQTAFYPTRYNDVVDFLNRLKVGSRILTYENLATIYGCSTPMPFKRHQDDVFEASWCANFHFHCYTKI